MIGQQGSLGVSPAALLAAKNMASGKSNMSRELSIGGDLTELMMASMYLQKAKADLEKAKLTQGANPQTTVAQDVQQGIAQLQGQAPQQAPQPQGQPQGQPQQMAQMDSGIGGLPAGAMDNEDAFAGGGIVAFAGPEGSGPVKSAERDPVDVAFDRLIRTESGGVHIDPKTGKMLTNKQSGAMGVAQFMPGTLRDPGFGVVPPRDNSREEHLRAGKDYFRAMVNVSNGNIAEGAARYNWGTGNVDNAKAQAQIKAKANPDKIFNWMDTAPNETKKYVALVAPQNTKVTEPAAPTKTDIASRILSTVTGTSDANAAEPSAPAKTDTTNAPRGDAVVGSPLAAAGIAATAAAAGTPAALRRVNEARRAADIAKLAGGQPIPPGSVVPSSAMRPPVTVGSLAKQAIPTKVGIGSLGTAGLIGAAGYDVASNVRDTPTSEFYRRLGIAVPDYSPDDSALTQIGQEAKTLGVRGLGALEEGLSTLTGGYYGQARGFKRPQAASTTAPTTKPVDAAPGVEKQSVDDASQADRGRGSTDREAYGKYAPKVDAYDEIRSLVKKLPPPESEDDAEERYQKTAEKFGVSAENIKKHFTDQADSLTKQADQARQDRNVNLWMSAAQGFFAMAGGMSPYAVKNFADGLGVGTKQMTQTLGEYNKEQREIDKANRELAKLNISSRMQMSKEYLDRREKARDKATTHQEKQINLLTSLSRIVMEDRRTDVLAGGRDADRLQKEQATKDRAVADLRKSEEYKNITLTIERLTNKKDRTPADTSNLAGLQLRKRQMMNAALGDSSSQSGGAGGRPDPSKIKQFDN